MAEKLEDAAASHDLGTCTECCKVYCLNCSDASEPDEWCSLECENA